MVATEEREKSKQVDDCPVMALPFLDPGFHPAPNPLAHYDCAALASIQKISQ